MAVDARSMIEGNSRKILTDVLRALAERGQSATAEIAAVSDTRLSRWKDSNAQGGGFDLEEVSRVLAALGLAVVPTDAGDLVTIPGKKYRAMQLLIADYAAAEAKG